MSRPRVKYLRGQPMGGYGVIYLEDVEDSSGSSSVRQALFKRIVTQKENQQNRHKRNSYKTSINNLTERVTQ